jgi:hypothetical protein
VFKCENLSFKIYLTKAENFDIETLVTGRIRGWVRQKFSVFSTAFSFLPTVSLAQKYSYLTKNIPRELNPTGFN